MSLDGHLVFFHDDTLDRVTSAAGPVRSRTLGELRALRINGKEPIPTFDEALDAFPDPCFTVDVKGPGGDCAAGESSATQGSC